MKRLLSLLTAALLCLLLVMPAFAEETTELTIPSELSRFVTPPDSATGSGSATAFDSVTGPDAIPSERLKPLLVDDADLLSTNQELELLTKLEKISAELECDFVIVTIPDLGGKDRMAYADDFYDYNGYGQGESRDGLLFLITMAERKWWVSTTGMCLKLSNDDIEYAVNEYGSSLTSGNYYEAFNGITDNFYKIVYAERHPSVAPKYIFIDLVIGFILAFIIMKIATGNLKSVRKQVNANEYVVPGSLALNQSYDRFLYSSVARTERETSSSSSGGGSHTSSSGTSHGGTGGSF